MRNREIITSTVVAGVLLGGCTAIEEVPAPTSPSSTTVEDPLIYQERPTENFSVGDCHRDSNNWAKHIDSEPEALKQEYNRDFTVGLAARFEDTHPVLATGAVIRSLGAGAYRIVTADDAGGESTTVDLALQSYSRVLEGESGYDGVLTARLGDDGYAHFTINCIADYDFNRNDPIPLPDDILPTLPDARLEDLWDA